MIVARESGRSLTNIKEFRYKTFRQDGMEAAAAAAAGRHCYVGILNFSNLIMCRIKFPTINLIYTLVSNGPAAQREIIKDIKRAGSHWTIPDRFPKHSGTLNLLL